MSGLGNPDAIEAKPAHADIRSARSIYNRAKYCSERVEKMNCWSEYVIRNTNAR